jgi:hypothetical protein
VLKSKGLRGLQTLTSFKVYFDFDKLRKHLFANEGKTDIYDNVKWNDNNLWNGFVVSGYLGQNVDEFVNNFKKYLKNEYL